MEDLHLKMRTLSAIAGVARSYEERIGELRVIPSCQPCRSELAREQMIGRITRQRYPPVARLADNLFQVMHPTKLMSARTHPELDENIADGVRSYEEANSCVPPTRLACRQRFGVQPASLRKLRQKWD